MAGVLKIANPAFSAAEIEAQDAAAELVAAGLRAGTVRHRQAQSMGPACTSAWSSSATGRR